VAHASRRGPVAIYVDAVDGGLPLLPLQQDPVPTFPKSGQRCSRCMRQPSRRIHKPFQSRSGLARQHLDEERLLRSGPRLIDVSCACCWRARFPMIRTVAVPACDPRCLGAAVFVLLDPDCFAASLEADRTA
jgi:hypothetical protein